MALEKLNSLHNRKPENYSKNHKRTALKYLKRERKKFMKIKNPTFGEKMVNGMNNHFIKAFSLKSITNQ
jgi:hypothetical protein